MPTEVSCGPSAPFSSLVGAVNRTGFAYRRNRQPRDQDLRLLLEKLGNRNSWRDEALAATVLLGELATRSTSAPPQSHADLGVASRLAALEKVVGTMAAIYETLKGVVLDHEVAILDMEHDLLKVRPKPGEERWPPWAEAGKTEPADDEVEKFLSGLQANQFEPPIKEPELEPGLQGMAGLIAEADEVLQEVVAPPPPPSAIELIESL